MKRVHDTYFALVSFLSNLIYIFNVLVHVLCSAEMNRTLVTLCLGIDVRDKFFQAAIYAVTGALVEALHCHSVHIKSCLPGDGAVLQVELSVDAAVHLYDYAIYAPGFLAGLGILHFNALGRYFCVELSQGLTRESKESSVLTFGECDGKMFDLFAKHTLSSIVKMIIHDASSCFVFQMLSSLTMEVVIFKKELS